MISVKVIKDSITEHGSRLTTLELTYPRIIHAEVLTHRDRARNAASSRAIPFKKMCDNVRENMFVPMKWGAERRGMQEGDSLPPELASLAEKLWQSAHALISEIAYDIHNIGEYYYRTTGDDSYREVRVHKSLPNRLLEPWSLITVVMTATEWKNFLRLRNHPDAEIHFQKLAAQVQDALEVSEPTEVPFGHWHLPYVNDDEIHGSLDWRKVSVARCARVSYLTHDGVRDPEADLRLFDRLVQGSGFGHWSPHEHVATPATPDIRSGCLKGWLQYRKFFKGENADA